MIESIVVCGAGTMGSGIAQAAAQNGYPTTLYDLNKNVLDNARLSVQKNLQLLVDKTKLTEARMKEISGRIIYTDKIVHCRADLIIEAIIEKPEAKKELFLKLAELNTPATLLASNTSSLSITAIAADIPHPERVFGLHFFNPAPVMKLVEVVQTSFSNKALAETLSEFVKSLGKTPVVCSDSPGFIVNRVARHYYLEALKLAEENACDIKDIDDLLESAGFRMGPFRLMDLIGNDINLAVTQSLYEASGKEVRFKPSPLQEQKVEIGELGRKTGKGYYRYEVRSKKYEV